jgi:hypothetical protein
MAIQTTRNLSRQGAIMSIFIQIRGNHGAGKTHMVRTIRARYDSLTAIYVKGRNLPIGYICRLKNHRKLFVAGSYEHPVSGGCDNINSVAQIFAPIRKYAKRGYDVLAEGIVQQHSTPNLLMLHERYKVRSLVINIPLEKAIRSVAKRRAGRGETKVMNTTNIENEQRVWIERGTERLRALGIHITVFHTRRDALHRALTFLRLEP